MTTPADRPTSYDVVTFGESMILLRAAAGEPLRTAVMFTRDIAGAEGNVAVGLARLGRTVLLALRLGLDPWGDVIAGAYRAEGVDLHLVRDPDRPTGLMVRDVHAGRPITVSYHRAGSAASALTPGDLPFDAIRLARVVHLSGITAVLTDTAAAAALAAVTAAREAGVTVTFDPNLRRRLAGPEASVARWQPIVEHCDIVLAGADEARLLAGGDDRAQIADWFHRHGVTEVVVKDGTNGSWASGGGDIVEVPALAVQTVDPVGAGDAYAAGFIDAMLDGASLAERMRRGSAVAAAAVEVVGDVNGLPSRDELDVMLSTDDRGDVHR